MSGNPKFESIKSEFQDIFLEDAAYPAIMPVSCEQVMHAVNWCRKSGWKLLPAGRGHSFGDKFKVPENVLTILSLSRTHVRELCTEDLTVEAEAGTPVQDLKAYVMDQGFRLDGLPSDYEGTIGGLICGDRGIQLRHLLLGADIVDGTGKSLRFGGKVRKNVAGFDVAGLFAGSKGRIGWLDRVYLRLLPLKASKTGYYPSRIRTSSAPTQEIYATVSGALDPFHIFFIPNA